MKEKIKIILSNVQMRNMIYLVCGIFFILILFLIYNPKFEYRSFNNIIDEEDVKIISTKKSINKILYDYSLSDNYYYTIYYKDYIVNGYSSLNIFYADIYIEEIKDIENIIMPNNIYKLIIDKDYIKSNNSYIYNINSYIKKITVFIENEMVKKIIIDIDDQIIIEYGG